MAMSFEVRQIDTTPQDTGINQYITLEVKIVQFAPDLVYADTEVYSGEYANIPDTDDWGIGLL